MFLNLYTILIITKHRSSLKLVASLYSSKIMHLFKWKNSWNICFCSLILVCLNQVLWDFSTMLITTKLISITYWSSVTFTFLEFYPFITLYTSRGIICVPWTHSLLFFQRKDMVYYFMTLGLLTLYKNRNFNAFKGLHLRKIKISQ